MSGMPRSIRRLMIVLACLAVGFGWVAYKTAQMRHRPVVEVLGEVPPFTLTDQDGRPFSWESLEGKIWIADFIFTRCAGPCPLMTARMKKLQDALVGMPEVRLVSFSVDPVADTPEALQAYATKYGADRSRWTFLTGDVLTLYTLIEKGFKLPVGPTPDPKEVGPGDLIVHTTRFVLVDGKGQVRGYFDSEAPGMHEKVIEAVEALREG